MRDSSGTPAELMAEPAPTEPPERRFDPLVWAAGVLFLLAIAFGSAPAWRAGPDTLAGLLLLVGLAGRRVGRFLQLAAEHDDPGNRHRQDEWTALRWSQKHEAAVWIAPQIEGEEWAPEWLRDDGLSDAERAAVYARLVEHST